MEFKGWEAHWSKKYVVTTSMLLASRYTPFAKMSKTFENIFNELFLCIFCYFV